VGETWRGRWDGFCLVTPNWTMRLPGREYDGHDAEGFDARDEIVAFLERYADANGLPVRTGVETTALELLPGGGFTLETSAGPIEAGVVVLCTGAYQRAHRPPGAAALPDDVLQLDVGDYRRPDALPDGPVLVVGGGQSGCQIAEELNESGRTVFLACGRAPWAPRRVDGRDIVWWLNEAGFLDAPVASLPAPAARLAGNLVTTGRDGGHDLHPRTLRRAGVTLLGRLTGASDHHARFAPDLGESMAWSDERHAQVMELVRKVAAEHGLPRPEIPEPEPFDPAAPVELDLRGFGAVLFAGGFRPGYASWVRCPEAFDELGFPHQVDGASTVVPGLYFSGVHFLRTRKSALFLGAGEDAAIVARRIAARAPA
jgi:putative flavoprotein involved in K+ transport